MSELGYLLLSALLAVGMGIVVGAAVAASMMLRNAQTMPHLARRALRLLARLRLPRSIRRHLPRYGAPAEPNYLLIAAMEAECGLTETRRTCLFCGAVTPSAEDACQQCGASAQKAAERVLRFHEFAQALTRAFSERGQL